MSEETTQSMDNSLAGSTNNGLREGNHDQRTVFQQNNAQQNELIQSLIEARRQSTAQFEQRMTQENQMFQNTMQMLLNNMDAANARSTATTQQQQSYTNQQALRDSANSVAMHYADVGALTIIP